MSWSMMKFPPKNLLKIIIRIFKTCFSWNLVIGYDIFDITTHVVSIYCFFLCTNVGASKSGVFSVILNKCSLLRPPVACKDICSSLNSSK